jgi:hypothetical protein
MNSAYKVVILTALLLAPEAARRGHAYHDAAAVISVIDRNYP